MSGQALLDAAARPGVAMKPKTIQKAPARWVLLCLLCASIPPKAFPWSQATHAYIADRLGARAGQDNSSELWGIVGPDLFIFIFDSNLCPSWVSEQTHGAPGSDETFMKVWSAASTARERALAYGFVAHNQAWGADYPAHVSRRTPGDQDGGYIIAKASDLLSTPSVLGEHGWTFDDELAALGIPAQLRPDVAHLLTEYAIDIRLRNDADPLLGRKLARAARGETKAFPGLLVKAFAEDYAAACFGGDHSTAARVLAAAEEQHRETMIFLGQAISQPEPVAVELLAEQVTGILSRLLGSLAVPEPEAIEIVKAGIVASMTLCSDYRAEIEATIEFVDRNLREAKLQPESGYIVPPTRRRAARSARGAPSSMNATRPQDQASHEDVVG